MAQVRLLTPEEVVGGTLLVVAWPTDVACPVVCCVTSTLDSTPWLGNGRSSTIVSFV